jgi:hypothetical protein
LLGSKTQHCKKKKHEHIEPIKSMNERQTDTEIAVLSVYERRGYEGRRQFNEQLRDKNSPVGKIVSAESIRRSSANIQMAIIETIVNNGHGAMLRQISPEG